MEDVLAILKTGRCEQGPITEKKWYELVSSSGHVQASDLFTSFAEETCELDYAFEAGKPYPVFVGLTEEDEVAYLRIELAQGPYAAIHALSAEREAIDDWDDCVAFDYSLTSECHFVLLDADAMEACNEAIEEKYEGDY